MKRHFDLCPDLQETNEEGMAGFQEGSGTAVAHFGLCPDLQEPIAEGMAGFQEGSGTAVSTLINRTFSHKILQLLPCRACRLIYRLSPVFIAIRHSHRSMAHGKAQDKFEIYGCNPTSTLTVSACDAAYMNACVNMPESQRALPCPCTCGFPLGLSHGISAWEGVNCHCPDSRHRLPDLAAVVA
ncbi:hypothetical protein J6590_005714 [Homalodisca vitripennis]|nr:hypothetical protein J6590_005714 [Homalodisca vitripennis]